MIADILTKPLSPPIYNTLRKLLLGYKIHVFPEQGWVGIGIPHTTYTYYGLWFIEYMTTDNW